MAEIGHNSVDKAKIKSYIDRLTERMTEKESVAQDIREIKAEIKDAGLDPAALVLMVKEQMRDAEKTAKAARLSETADQYKAALGMLF